jgi:hypothetical protein
VTPVLQTQFVAVDGKGNCLQACIASMLDLPLGDVPTFRDMPNMVHAMDRFLISRGKRRIGVSFSGGFEWGDASFEDMNPGNDESLKIGGSPVLIFGKSPRSGDHAIVGEFVGRYNWKLLHDPHPDATGIVGSPQSIHFIVPLK